MQERQNQKIGCLEEIAFKKKWINKILLKSRIKFYGKNEYSEYLPRIFNNQTIFSSLIPFFADCSLNLSIIL